MTDKLDVVLVGYGAIGKGVLQLLNKEAQIGVSQLIVREHRRQQTSQALPHIFCYSALSQLSRRPDVLLECAGHNAIVDTVIPALQQGVDCVICSVGALADPQLFDQVVVAAKQGQARVELVSGAIGGLDALAAAAIGGLDDVIYSGRKPPSGWQGSAAEELCDLHQLTVATTFFRGSAREAARRFPKNANVAASVAFAGLGLDATQVELIADPTVQRNTHRLRACGNFGEIDLTLANLPLAANPKTSALTVYSAVQALRSRCHYLVI